MCCCYEEYVRHKMGRNKLNLQEDKYLAEEVQKYACLYDKGCKEYKSKTSVKNAWKKVEITLGYEEGKITI